MPSVFRGSTSPYTRQQLRAKRFSKVTHDIYVEDGDAADPWVRARGVPLVHADAILCGSTAALLQRLPVDDDGLVHFTRGQLAARSERPQWRLHRLDVADDEITEIDGLRMTAGPRCWTDLAGSFDLEGLVSVGDVILRRHGLEALSGAVERAWGRSGVLNLRQALPLLDARSDSPAESRARVRLHRAGFTELRPGHVIRDELGGWVAAPDLADPLAGVAVQHDGAVHFLSDARRRRMDVDRDEQSRLLGWEVVVSTVSDDRRPELLIEKVAAAYRRASARRGASVLPDHLRAA